MKNLSLSILSLVLLGSTSVMAAGDPAAGKNAYATCAACHGMNGEGNPSLQSPKLAGQYDWYLASSLKKYRDGIRGKDPKDTSGMMMAPMAAKLTDKQIDDIVAYIGTFK